MLIPGGSPAATRSTGDAPAPPAGRGLGIRPIGGRPARGRNPRGSLSGRGPGAGSGARTGGQPEDAAAPRERLRRAARDARSRIAGAGEDSPPARARRSGGRRALRRDGALNLARVTRRSTAGPRSRGWPARAAFRPGGGRRLGGSPPFAHGHRQEGEVPGAPGRVPAGAGQDPAAAAGTAARPGATLGGARARRTRRRCGRRPMTPRPRRSAALPRDGFGGAAGRRKRTTRPPGVPPQALPARKGGGTPRPGAPGKAGPRFPPPPVRAPLPDCSPPGAPSRPCRAPERPCGAGRPPAASHFHPAPRKPFSPGRGSWPPGGPGLHLPHYKRDGTARTRLQVSLPGMPPPPDLLGTPCPCLSRPCGTPARSA
jgi:hypothetical protein